MIDTIVLTLPEGQFRILDYDKFTPSARGLFEPPFYKLGKNGIIRCIQNPTTEDKRRGRYRPRLNMTKRLDLNKTDYRNEGHSLRFHANSYEVVFYDKIQDLRQARISEKRAIENNNWVQLGVLKEGGLPKGLEVLRMEVRLNTRRKIKSLCESLGLPPPQTLRDALRPDIAQTILLHFWGLIERELNVVSLSRYRPDELFQLLITSGEMKPTKAFQILGGRSLIQSIGIRGLRSLMGKASNRTWQRFKKDIENCPISASPKAQMMHQIRESLIEFSPIKLYGCSHQNFDDQKDVMKDDQRSQHI